MVVGAGICGLVIANELLKTGKKVLVLEARDRVGGRIQTETDKFSVPVDTGAEFIHGDLPLTKSLLMEAGIVSDYRKGKIYKSQNKTIFEINNFIEDFEPVLNELNKLTKDVSLSEFLSGTKINKDVKTSVINFAEGFDAADPEKISSFSIRNEWNEQDHDSIMQIKEGHGKLIKYLLENCINRGCNVLLSSEIIEVQWKNGFVKVTCADDHNFEAEKIILTVPLGILTTKPGEKGHITFIPAIPQQIESAKKIGYGSVVKVILEFKTAFWLNKDFENETAYLPELDFLICDNFFTTWWTHSNKEAGILIGWVGGPKAEILRNKNEEEILSIAIASLAEALKTTVDFLQKQLINRSAYNWGANPFTRGAYSYNTLESDLAKEILANPLEQTVYFSGEALSTGESIGTVESAIESAMQTVEKVLLNV